MTSNGANFASAFLITLFSLKTSYLPGKFSSFHCVKIHIKIKSLLEYKSVWPSGCSITGSDHSITGSSSDGIQLTYLSSFNFELVYFLPAFHCSFFIFRHTRSPNGLLNVLLLFTDLAFA